MASLRCQDCRRSVTCQDSQGGDRHEKEYPEYPLKLGGHVSTKTSECYNESINDKK